MRVCDTIKMRQQAQHVHWSHMNTIAICLSTNVSVYDTRTASKAHTLRTKKQVKCAKWQPSVGHFIVTGLFMF
jgi:hypothetical protein